MNRHRLRAVFLFHIFIEPGSLYFPSARPMYELLIHTIREQRFTNGGCTRDTERSDDYPIFCNKDFP